MHEFSLVQSLLEQVDEVVSANGGLSAVEVRVEIGPLSGVEPLLVKEAFAQLIADTRHAESSLVIDEVQLTLECHCCRVEFDAADFCFVCPHCGSREARILGGDQFRLMSVTLDIPEETSEVSARPIGLIANHEGRSS